MTLGEWLNDFRGLHARYKLGTLGPEELARYRAAREDCARVLTAMQNQGLQDGRSSRRELRVSRALPVQIEFPDRVENAITLELSPSGFGAFLGQCPAQGDRARIGLRLPGGHRLSCQARVLAVRKLGTTARVSFELVDAAAPEAERLETFLLDAVLEQLRSTRTDQGTAAVG